MTGRHISTVTEDQGKTFPALMLLHTLHWCTVNSYYVNDCGPYVNETILVSCPEDCLA